MSVIGTSLAVGATVTTLASAGLGGGPAAACCARSSRVADAASELAEGGLDTRLPEESDPDLHRLVSSFNDMADAVQDRIEREARFASDVSHELRSPITALTAAVEVLDSRRDDLPGALATGARRRHQPGAPLRPDGARPPRDLPPRRRRGRAQPRAGRSSATSCAASPPATASTYVPV